MHPFALIVTAVALAVTAALSWAAYAVNDHSEARLLRLKVEETGAVLQAAIPRIQTTLTSAAEFADASDDPAQGFRTFITRYVGEKRGQTFGSASLWRVTPGAPSMVTYVGARPKLADEPDKARAVLTHATKLSGIGVVGLLAGPAPRLGYTYAMSSPRPDYVVYAESLLPSSRKIPASTGGGPFSDLRFALYLGKRATPSHLLEANISGPHARTASVVVPFGDQSLTLVASSSDPLGGTLSNALWWIVALAGGVLSLAAGVVGERLVRRRLAAEALAGDVQRLLDGQRHVSETLQRAMVPPAPPPVAGLDIAVRYLPGAAGLEIGGDWYDVVDLDDGRLVLSIGDVSGRGIQAGAVMSSLRSATRAFISEGHSPGPLLGKVSRLLRDTAGGYFATMLCAVVDPGARRLTVACAGHLPPLLISDGRACYLDIPVGPPVGAIADPPAYAEQTVDLPAAASLLLYTDGLIERRGETIDQGLDRLRHVASRTQAPIDEVLTAITSELSESEPNDDTAVLGVQWT